MVAFVGNPVGFARSVQGNTLRGPGMFIGKRVALIGAAIGVAGGAPPYEASLRYPPDNVTAGSTIGNGVWGIDFDESASVRLSGVRSLWFRPTQPFLDPYVESEKAYPVQGGVGYNFEATVQADSIAAGNTVAIEARWYDSDDAYISSGNVYAAAVLPAADTWLTASASILAPSTARFARIRVTRSKNPFSLYVDSWEIEDAVPSGRFYRAGGVQSIPNSTSTTVIFDTAEYERGMTLDTGTGIVTVERAGIYAVNVGYTIASIDNGSTVATSISGGGKINTPGTVHPNWSGAAATVYASTSSILICGPGDTIYAFVVQTSAAARNLGFGQYTTVMSIIRLE